MPFFENQPHGRVSTPVYGEFQKESVEENPHKTVRKLQVSRHLKSMEKVKRLIRVFHIN